MNINFLSSSWLQLKHSLSVCLQLILQLQSTLTLSRWCYVRLDYLLMHLPASSQYESVGAFLTNERLKVVVAR